MNMKSLAPPGKAVPHVPPARESTGSSFVYYTANNMHTIPQLASIPAELRFEMKIAAIVFPFKVNRYVLDELIDWSEVPDDPIFQLTFPQRGMLDPDDFDALADLVKREASIETIRTEADRVRRSLNPQPAGQTTLNVPELDGEALPGLQHKYAETVLYFPAAGQTCHSYCTYCFRWPQFAGMKDMRIASRDTDRLVRYLGRHPGVTNVLLTGGDPMVIKTSKLAAIVEPMLTPALDHVHSIRFGTKALGYWPQRFVTDPDADELLRLFSRIIETGRSVAIMAHCNHYHELETPMAREAVRRIRDTGAVIRSQSPLIARINDTPAVWELMWREQVRLGIIPYYMFVERDTGARRYFEVPLHSAVKIFREAYRHVNGLARTVRGPSMSAMPGKVEITGTAVIGGEKVFALRFLQARNPDWVGKPFFAAFDPDAVWLDDLKPAFGARRFFYEDELDSMVGNHSGRSGEAA